MQQGQIQGGGGGGPGGPDPPFFCRHVIGRDYQQICIGCLKDHCCLNMTDRSLLLLLKFLLNFELNFYLKVH